MRRIKKENLPVHFESWKNTFKQNQGRNATYDDWVADKGEYPLLMQDLLKEQGYICCYCERAIGRGKKKDCDIEHFMPRHPDKNKLTAQECALCTNAQLEYTNMFASCLGEEADSLNHCNHKKSNWYDFKTCVSPVSEEVEGLFEFRLDGKIIGKNAKADAMKKHLNLDTYVLREQRKKAFDTVWELEFPDENDELSTDMTYIADTIYQYDRRDRDGKFVPFCSMITDCLKKYMAGFE